MVELQPGEHPTREELADLYGSVGWSAYTEDIEELDAGVQGSTYVVTARDDGELVGLARVISDDRTIAYFQDLLVHPDHQGAGLGTDLMHNCMDRFEHVRTIMLLTDHEKRQHAFYASLGFTDTRNTALHSFVRFRRPDSTRWQGGSES